jgi:X-X-X-Leu-X-X-Gly heptad repeat protein
LPRPADNRRLATTVLALLLVVVTTVYLAFPVDLQQAAWAADAEPALSACALSEQSDPVAGTAQVKDKEEVVYASLSASGQAEAAYVINHFKLSTAGSFSDWGSYDSVVNLSNTAPLTQDGNAVLASAEAGDYYYQGNLSAPQLPWQVAVSYRLNGQGCQASELAGASGKLEISLETSQNPKVNKVFYENYLLQVTITLDTASTDDIKAPDAALALSGSDSVITWTVLPNQDGDLSLSAQVSDLEMPGIQIVAAPFSMVFELPDTEDMTADMQELSDGIAEFNSGVQSLNAGVAEMDSGASTLAEGAGQFGDGIDALASSSQSLRDASNQFNSALTSLSGGIDPAQLAQLTSLPALLGGINQWLSGITTAIQGFQTGITQVQQAGDSFAAAIQPADPNISNTDIVTALQISGFATSYPDEYAEIVKALGNSTAAQQFSGAWTLQLSPALTSINGGLDIIINGSDNGTPFDTTDDIPGIVYWQSVLTPLASMDLSGLAALSNIQTLATNYASFNSGIASYSQGVDALASNYDQLSSGISEFSSGISTLHSGTAALADGSSELAFQTRDLPQKMQEQIDEFMADYDYSGFEPVSFASEKNSNIALVQFVLTTPPIEKPEAPTEVIEPATPTFWDRVTGLFD